MHTNTKYFERLHLHNFVNRVHTLLYYYQLVYTRKMISLKMCNLLHKVRLISNLRQCSSHSKDFMKFDLPYLCNENNLEEIQTNINHRKGVGNIKHVIDIYKQYLDAKNNNSSKVDDLGLLLYEAARKIPNKTHHQVKNYGNDPKIIKLINEMPEFGDTEPLEFADIARYLNIMRTDQLGPMTGHRSYYFMSDLAELEEALIKYSVNHLLGKGFQLVSVPDVLPSHVIESCGMTTTGERTQVS